MMVIMNIFIVGLLLIILEIEAKSYYFNVNKTTNEFIIYNRVNLNGSVHHNYPSAIRISELRNNVTSRRNNTIGPRTHPLLDPEWDYNWQNITRRKLPPFIYKVYDLAVENMIGPTKILFNFNPQNSTIIKFNLSDINVNENISDAELHFYYSVDEKLHQKSLILRLYQMENDHFNETSLINPDAHKLLNVIYILQAESGWQVFKLINTIQNWSKIGENLTLLITISKPNEDQFSLFKDTNRDIFRTFLILKSGLPNKDSSSNEIKVQEGSCRRYDLNIDFEKLNWMKFIISPTGYNAYNCYGRCYKDNNLPNHMKVANYLQEFNRKPLSCVPTEYTSLPIMFYNKNGNIIIKIYENMIISDCGCR